jgi:hypothetical protein
MALADLMKKGFLTSATATVATPAPQGRAKILNVAVVGENNCKIKLYKPPVAGVAEIAVAKTPNDEGADLAVKQNLALLNKLTLFHFDLVQQEITNGCPPDELHRIKNMAWEFMQFGDMAFDEAITLAGNIVAHGQVAACEAAYTNVRELFERLQTYDEK